MAFSTELTELRLATYWDALSDLPVEAIEAACSAAVREEPKFPVPYTLRTLAKHYRDTRVAQAVQEARAMLPQWSETPDEVGLEAIRKVLDMLGDDLALKHDVYQRPSTDTPEARRALLLEQARQVIEQHTNGHKEATHE